MVRIASPGSLQALARALARNSAMPSAASSSAGSPQAARIPFMVRRPSPQRASPARIAVSLTHRPCSPCRPRRCASQVTHAMNRQLASLGYAVAEIRHMTPAEAHYVIGHEIVPSQWQAQRQTIRRQAEAAAAAASPPPPSSAAPAPSTTAQAQWRGVWGLSNADSAAGGDPVPSTLLELLQQVKAK